MPDGKRVRTGCWTCRRRGYRCDEVKPSCKTCSRLGIPCEGYAIRLRWMSDSSSTPGQRARRGKSTDNAHKPGDDKKKRAGDSEVTAELHLSPRPSIQPPPSKLASEKSFLLQHFFYTISGLLSSTSDSSINTYCRVIIPMGLSSDLLLDAIFLVSSSHLATRFDPFNYRTAWYKNRVLNGVIKSIRSQSGFEVTTLATIIMLSIHEVFEANVESWVKHLMAAGTIIRNYLSKCQAPDTDTQMLFDIFLYHNVLALVSTRQPNLFMDCYTDDNWTALSGRRTAFLASVDTLLYLVARLSIYSAEPGATGWTSAVSDATSNLCAVQRELNLWTPPEGIPDDSRNTAEAMRHAALLYHRRSTASPQSPDASMRRSPRAIIQHIGDISVCSPAVASHVWPLYMAGTATRDSDDQAFIRGRLSEMKSSRGIKSIDRVRERLEQLWKTPNDRGNELEDPLILF